MKYEEEEEQKLQYKYLFTNWLPSACLEKKISEVLKRTYVFICPYILYVFIESLFVIIVSR